MSNNMKKSTKSKKGGKIVLAVCIIVIIALLGVVIYLLLNKEDDNPAKRNVVVNEDNVEQIIKDSEEERVAPGYYEVTMNSTWDFADGISASDNAYVKNAETNHNAVYFDITLADTDETIYESPIIPVGSYLDNITLESKLEAGTYECVMTYHLLDEDEKSISTVRVSLTIVIAA